MCTRWGSYRAGMPGTSGLLCLTTERVRSAQPHGVQRRTLERELAELVASGQVRARIDSAAKVLTACLADTRTATFQRALSVGVLLASRRSLLCMLPHQLSFLSTGLAQARHAVLRDADGGRRAGEAYIRDTRALLLRASLLQHDLVQVMHLIL